MQFKLHFASSNLYSRWWSFEDETEGKKLSEGVLPDEDGWGGLADDDPEEVKKLYDQGWIYSYPLRSLSIELMNEEDASFMLTA